MQQNRSIGPMVGQAILYCPHALIGPGQIYMKAPHEWYLLDKEKEVTSPDGRTFSVRWVVLCEACHLQHRAAPDKPIADFLSPDPAWIRELPQISRIQ